MVVEEGEVGLEEEGEVGLEVEEMVGWEAQEEVERVVKEVMTQPQVVVERESLEVNEGERKRMAVG